MATIEEIRSNIDPTDFGTILRYIDDPQTEFQYAIIVLEGDLAEVAAVAINGEAVQWQKQMDEGVVKFMMQAGYLPANPQALLYSYPRKEIPESEMVDVLAVPPGFFIKRRK